MSWSWLTYFFSRACIRNLLNQNHEDKRKKEIKDENVRLREKVYIDSTLEEYNKTPIEDEIKFYEDLMKHYNEDNCILKRPKSSSISLKRLSGLGNVYDECYRSELMRRLEAKSRANVIGWRIISAKSAPNCRTNSRHFQHRYSSVLDEQIKIRIYEENLPLGVPRSIKTLSYCEQRDSNYIVKTRNHPLKIFSSPVKKTGLLKSRDGGLRNSYKILRDGLRPRSVEFDPSDLAEVDPEYVRKSLSELFL